MIRSYSRSLLTLALMAMTGALAHATSVVGGGPCVQDTLFNYEIATSDGPGTGCTVAPNLEYTNFYFFVSASQYATATDANGITVTPDGGFGFNFTGFPENDNGTVTYYIAFDVDPAPVLTGDSLSLDPPFGNVTLNLYACINPDQPYITHDDGGTFFCSTQPVGGTASQIDFGAPPQAQLVNVDGSDQFTTYNFPSQTGVIGLLMTLTLDADDPAGVGAIGNAPTQILPTPEPASWLLMGLGIVGFGLWSRRSRLPFSNTKLK